METNEISSKDIQTSTKRIELMREVSYAWSKACDALLQATKEYDSARANFRKISKEVTEQRIQELKKKLFNWQEEYREITDAVLEIKAKIDKLNSLEWRFRY